MYIFLNVGYFIPPLLTCFMTLNCAFFRNLVYVDSDPTLGKKYGSKSEV